MDYSDAKDLWDNIIEFAECTGQLSAEGNSGEFHDEDDEIQFRKELTAATCALCDSFEKITGWLPVLTEASQENDFTESWDLWDVRKES